MEDLGVIVRQASYWELRVRAKARRGRRRRGMHGSSRVTMGLDQDCGNTTGKEWKYFEGRAVEIC